jgi:acyl-CoA synthetase (AMP-forming)/AMP-acid ligase II
LYKVEELASQLKSSGASVIVTHKISLATAIEAAKEAKIPESKIFLFGDETISDILPYTSLMGEREAIPVEFTPEEVKTTPVYLCYSSGTTGKQKGVETTHLNIIANAIQILAIEDYSHSGIVYMGVLVCFLFIIYVCVMCNMI